MELWGDRRGQPVQIGFILLFGVLVLAFAGYQGYVVPQENAEVEFNHNQEVRNGMQDVRSGVLRVDGMGTRQSASLRLGTTYPGRAVALNPAPATGTLRTAGPADVTVRHAEATGETGDYWNGEERAFATRPIAYSPGYNVYEGAPTTRIEQSVLYDEFDDGTVVARSRQALVSGRSLSFVFVDGDYGRSGSGSVAVDAEPVSASANRVAVEAANRPIEIELRTEIPESVWVGDLLADQIDGAAGDETRCTAVGTTGDDHANRYVDDCEYEEASGPNALTLVLESGATYTLRSAKVGVGSGVTDPVTAYVTDVEGDGATIPEGGEQRLVAEVRDGFDNPVGGVETCAEVDGDGRIEGSTTATSDEEGRVSFTYAAPEVDRTRTETVLVDHECTDGNPDVTGTPAGETHLVTFGVTVNDVDGSGGGGNGGGATS